MKPNNAFDASIPVLTEVFHDADDTALSPGATPGLASAPAPATLALAGVAADPAALEERAIASWSGQDWAQLEQRLSERILHQLQGRVDFVLEQRLRDSMEDVLKHALAGLSAQIQQGLQQTIEQIVLRAVAQELAHLQTLKK
jgi:hypothetical protein